MRVNLTDVDRYALIRIKCMQDEDFCQFPPPNLGSCTRSYPKWEWTHNNNTNLANWLRWVFKVNEKQTYSLANLIPIIISKKKIIIKFKTSYFKTNYIPNNMETKILIKWKASD